MVSLDQVVTYTHSLGTNKLTFIDVVIQGRHNCLWCLITKSQLSLRPDQRPVINLRTTDSILADHSRSVRNGAVLKKAKLFNNVVRSPLFQDIPLHQVRLLPNHNEM